MTTVLPTIALIGGTGDLGTGLARRWARAGYPVIIGSRETGRAEEAAASLRARLDTAGPSCRVEAMDNLGAATQADIVVLTVPFSHHAATLQLIKPAVQGKVLVDVTVPLVPPKVARVQMPPQGSAGLIAQALLGEEVRVVSAFQNVAAHLLQGDDAELGCDVLVCGNDTPAREQVVQLAVAAGLRGFHAGSLHNSVAVEALTSLLIFINKQYQCHAGIRLTGV